MAWTYHPDLLATPVPRYTSYPTAAEFDERIGRADLERGLDGIAPDESLSLYVHIPFCHEICWYCGCNTGAANRTQRLSSYLDSLKAEIALVATRLAGRGRVGRIAFGGGSPNALEPDVFYELLSGLRRAFRADDALISIELDPRSLNPGWFEMLGRARVERASLGVQTLEEKVQRAIGRIQPEGLIRTAVAGLRGAGITSLNFDLMYGLPYQGEAELAATLETAIAMRPDRVALFGYAHVPHMIPRQRQIDDGALPDAALRFRQAELGHRLLTAAGYQPVGFDHYALPDDPLAVAARDGRLRRNFQGFTDDSAEVLIGLGASSISQFPDLIVQTQKNAGRYRMSIGADLLAAERGVVRSPTDRLRGRIIEQLLCDGEANAGAICGAEELERLRPFTERQLATINDGILRIAPNGRPYARVIAAIFDSYRQPSARRFSNAI